MIDTHCHLTFPDFAKGVGDELELAASAGVSGVITISTTSDDCLTALEIASANDRVWCSAGVHPLYSDKGPHDWDAIRRAASHPKCVAFGELGLDNHYDKPPRETQRGVLEEQLAFIDRCKRDGIDHPVVLHCREAFDDLIPVLRATGWEPSSFVFHCFTGGPGDVRKVLDFGAWVSFTGIVTYPNAPEVAEAAKLVPLDRIMVETDAPFLPPQPVRKERPCRPAFVRHTAEHLAMLRDVPFEDFHRRLNDNTSRFFGIDAR